MTRRSTSSLVLDVLGGNDDPVDLVPVPVPVPAVRPFGHGHGHGHGHDRVRVSGRALCNPSGYGQWGTSHPRPPRLALRGSVFLTDRQNNSGA